MHSESDWRPPKNQQQARNWKSKVQWALLDAYDVSALERSRTGIQEVDQESAGALKQQQNLENYISGLESLPTPAGVIPHTIFPIDGDGTNGA